jgi:hypothetical protein
MPLASQLKFCIQYIRERFCILATKSFLGGRLPHLEINYFNNDSGITKASELQTTI